MAKGEYPSDKADQYMLRFPEGMRDGLKAAANEHKRSLNAEIIRRLEAYAAHQTLSEFEEVRSERLEAELAEAKRALRDQATASVEKNLVDALPPRLAERVAQAAATSGRTFFDQVVRSLEEVFPPLEPFSLDWFRDEWLSRIAAAPPKERESLIDEANTILAQHGGFFEIWYSKPLGRNDPGEVVLSMKNRDEREPSAQYGQQQK